MSTGAFTRRDLLRTGLIMTSTVVLAAPAVRFVSPARAALSDVPVVDRLAVTNVIDAYYDLLAPNETRPDGTRVERGRGHISGEHGLALFLESSRGEETKRVMLDFGWTPRVLLANLDHLGLDIGRVEAFVVSHGHADHFGGLMGLLAERRQAMPADIPLYIGGDDALCMRWSAAPDGSRRPFGVLDRTGLEEAGVRLVKAETGAVVAGHGFTSGVIERDSGEEVIANTLVEIGEVDGNGCTGAQHEGHFTAEELAGNFLFDHHWGEHVTAYHVRDRGLVVMTSCGHAGLVNSVRQAQRASGIEKVHAVMGGFHLSPADPGYVEQVIDQLVEEADPDYLVPMHCSGANFSYITARKYPEKLINSYVGTRFVFGA
jgi:7,8-dihydropterin-6-yl-methyl-4-(beta-D-ribofuranosyl)aminobenzene 5'-phosphate synthase